MIGDYPICTPSSGSPPVWIARGAHEFSLNVSSSLAIYNYNVIHAQFKFIYTRLCALCQLASVRNWFVTYPYLRSWRPIACRRSAFLERNQRSNIPRRGRRPRTMLEDRELIRLLGVYDPPVTKRSNTETCRLELKPESAGSISIGIQLTRPDHTAESYKSLEIHEASRSFKRIY